MCLMCFTHLNTTVWKSHTTRSRAGDKLASPKPCISCFSRFSEAWRSLRTGPRRMKRRWKSRRSSSKRLSTLLKRLTASMKRSVLECRSSLSEAHETGPVIFVFLFWLLSSKDHKHPSPQLWRENQALRYLKGQGDRGSELRSFTKILERFPKLLGREIFFSWLLVNKREALKNVNN